MNDKDNYHDRYENHNSQESLSNKGLYLLIKWGLIFLVVVGAIAASIGMVVSVAIYAYKAAPFILVVLIVVLGFWWLSKAYPDEGSNR